jgi:hypothetical protein
MSFSFFACTMAADHTIPIGGHTLTAGKITRFTAFTKDRSNIWADCYQIRHRVSCTIACPCLQWNAFWNSSMLETTLLTRSDGIECQSVRMSSRANSGLISSPKGS